MIVEKTIPEKETEVTKVTFDEIENAIESLSVIKDISMRMSVASSLMCKLTKDAEGIKKAATTLDEIMGIALKSTTLLCGIMKQSGCNEASGIVKQDSSGKISGIRTQNCMDNKFCNCCKHYQPDKNTHICTNEKSENFNINTAPFQKCSCFSEDNTRIVKEVIKDDTII